MYALRLAIPVSTTLGCTVKQRIVLLGLKKERSFSYIYVYTDNSFANKEGTLKWIILFEKNQLFEKTNSGVNQDYSSYIIVDWGLALDNIDVR